MKLKSFQVCVMLGLLSGLLSSCGTSGDVVNPTINQMDKLDVQWGLAPRQSKGTPRKTLAPQEQYSPAPAGTSYAPPTSYAPAPAPAPVTVPASQPAPITVDPTVIKTLR